MKTNHFIILCLLFQLTAVAQYNPPYFNPPWTGRPLPTKENPIIGMGGFVHDSIYSPSFGKSIGYSVVLPKHYFDKSFKKKSFPVIYYLHGSTGTECADIQNSKYYYGKTAVDSFPEVIMVFPNGMTGYSDRPEKSYFMETHIIKELIPFIDKQFRTNEKCRGLAGFSMGASGAMTYYLKYPKLFSHVLTIDGSYGSKASGFSQLDSCLKKNKGIEPQLKIMIVERKRPENLPSFSKYLDSKGIKHIFYNADLVHDATLFYQKYLTEIMEFEKINLCK